MQAVVFVVRCVIRLQQCLMMRVTVIVDCVSIPPAHRSWHGLRYLLGRFITRRASLLYSDHPPGDSVNSAGTAAPSCCSEIPNRVQQST